MLRKQKEYCTFKPKINNTKKYLNKEVLNNENNPPVLTTVQRMEMMYNKGKMDLLKKQHRKQDEVEYDRDTKEFTFKPNLNEK